jgi:hypothetical protein
MTPSHGNNTTATESTTHETSIIQNCKIPQQSKGANCKIWQHSKRVKPETSVQARTNSHALPKDSDMAELWNQQAWTQISFKKKHTEISREIWDHGWRRKRLEHQSVKPSSSAESWRTIATVQKFRPRTKNISNECWHFMEHVEKGYIVINALKSKRSTGWYTYQTTTRNRIRAPERHDHPKGVILQHLSISRECDK